MLTLGEDNPLRVLSGSGVDISCELRLLSEQLSEILLIRIPVRDRRARYPTLHGSLGNRCAHLGDKSWVYRFRNEIPWAERKVVDMVDLVHHIRHWLLGQVGNGMYGSELHLLVDAACMNVECSAEYVWEAYNVVNLVRIVRATGRHKHVGTACHGILVANLRHRIGKCEHYWLGSHRAHHVLSKHVAFGQSYEDIGVAHSLLQSVYVTAVSSKESLLRCKVWAVRRDYAL